MMKHAIIFQILFLLAAGSSASAETVISGANDKVEKNLRISDAAALDALKNSLIELETLLKKYKGTRQESVLTYRTAENYRAQGALYYRMSHASVKSQEKNLVLFKKSMKDAIARYSIVISRFSSFGEIDRAYFSRGKTYEELSDIKNAKNDYLVIVKEFRDSVTLLPSLMSLAVFAADANSHAEAAGYLKQVEDQGDSPYFPFALYKMAWAKYNLKLIDDAKTYIEKHITYYLEKSGSVEALVANQSNAAIVETSLLDAALFYYEGFNLKNPSFKSEKALGYFKQIDKLGEYGKMMIRYTKLLRSNGYEEELLKLKDQLLAEESERPETLDAVIVVFDYLVNKNRYELVGSVSKDIAQFYNKNRKKLDLENVQKAQKILLTTAESYQKLTIKNRLATEIGTLKNSLSSLYYSFISMIQDDDIRAVNAHYNLAETLFSVEDFKGATSEYLWIHTHLSKNKKNMAFYSETALKLIASRYKEFESAGDVIPASLNAIEISKNTDEIKNQMVKEFNFWTDEYLDDNRGMNGEFATFYFEAARMLYSKANLKTALTKLNLISHKYADSKYALPAASLVLDTLVKSENWEAIIEESRFLSKNKTFAEANFSSKLNTMTADAYYKITEKLLNAKDYGKALSYAKSCVKDFANFERVSDCLLVSGLASKGLSEEISAVKYFSLIVSEYPSSKNAEIALFERMKIYEARYDFKNAATDILAFISKVTKNHVKAKELHSLSLSYAFYAEDEALMNSALSTELCSMNQLKCDEYKAFREYKDLTGEITVKTDNPTINVLAAMKSLKNASSLSSKVRSEKLELITENFSKINEVFAMPLLHELSPLVQDAYRMNREEIAKTSELKADVVTIKRRINRIKSAESLSEKIVKFAPVRIKAEVLNEVASLYSDMADGIRAIAKPKNLSEDEFKVFQEEMDKVVLPFEEKAQVIREKAFMLALENKIEAESFDRIKLAYEKENPSKAKKLLAEAARKPAAVESENNPMSLAALDPNTNWKNIENRVVRLQTKEDTLDGNDRQLLAKALWMKALKAGNWFLMSQMLSEVKKFEVDAKVMRAMRSLALEACGHHAEAVKEGESS